MNPPAKIVATPAYSLPDKIAGIYQMHKKVTNRMVSFDLVRRGQKRLLLSKIYMATNFRTKPLFYLDLL